MKRFIKDCGVAFDLVVHPRDPATKEGKRVAAYKRLLRRRFVRPVVLFGERAKDIWHGYMFRHYAPLCGLAFIGSIALRAILVR